METKRNNPDCQEILICQSIDSEPYQESTKKSNTAHSCPHCGIVPWENDVENKTTTKLSLSVIVVLGIITLLVIVIGILSLVLFIPKGAVERRRATNTHLNQPHAHHILNSISSTVPFLLISSIFVLTLVFTYNTYQHTEQPPPLHHGRELQELQYHLQQQKQILFTNNDVDMHYATILSQLIQCKTISFDVSLKDHTQEQHDSIFHEEALRFHSILELAFPTLHTLFPPHKISTYSLVYEIIPPNLSNRKRKPILFCSHLDVVPASFGNEIDGHINTWKHDPFGGDIVQGCIWGRGAVDNKCNVLAQLAAIENILTSPQVFHRLDRVIFIAIGHDEEIGGSQGAGNIFKYFTQRKLTFEYILDEGNIMVSNFIPGMKGYLALIGTIEKGLMNVELSVTGLGGHASMPPIHHEGNIHQDRRILPILLRALLTLENHPLPSHFGPSSPLRRMLEIVARQKLLSFPMNVIFSNFWFFAPIVKQVLKRISAGAAASIRTTTAITRIMGGDKLNSLPTQVKAYINHRIHPQDSIESVLSYDKRMIHNPRVEIRLLDGSRPPSKDSGHTSSGYRRIEESVRVVFDLPSAPSLVVGNTDTYWYWSLSDQIYRFLPIAMALKDTTMVHGYNERINVTALSDVVKFYETLVLIDSLN